MSQETMNTIMTAVVVPLVVALVPFVISYLNKLSESVRAKIKDDKFKKYVTIAEDSIETAVLSVMQTYVDTIKKNGGWNEDTQKEAFAKAKIQAITIMGESAREVLKEAYGDIDALINAKIEAYVGKSKAA